MNCSTNSIVKDEPTFLSQTSVNCDEHGKLFDCKNGKYGVREYFSKEIGIFISSTTSMYIPENSGWCK